MPVTSTAKRQSFEIPGRPRTRPSVKAGGTAPVFSLYSPEKWCAPEPGQYIWRRRLEQYGSRLAKPYPFYDWVRTAKKTIRERGEKPIALALEPYGAEIAHPAKRFVPVEGPATPPDPKGKVTRDTAKLVTVDATVVPPIHGRAARVHLTFTLNATRNAARNAVGKAHWNNEVEPLTVWLDEPENGWQLARRLLKAPHGKKPETRELRCLDFDVKPPSGAVASTRLKGYALYYVCEDRDGRCLFLRQDFSVDCNFRK